MCTEYATCNCPIIHINAIEISVSPLHISMSTNQSKKYSHSITLYFQTFNSRQVGVYLFKPFIRLCNLSQSVDLLLIFIIFDFDTVSIWIHFYKDIHYHDFTMIFSNWSSNNNDFKGYSKAYLQRFINITIPPPPQKKKKKKIHNFT